MEIKTRGLTLALTVSMSHRFFIKTFVCDSLKLLVLTKVSRNVIQVGVVILCINITQINVKKILQSSENFNDENTQTSSYRN